MISKMGKKVFRPHLDFFIDPIFRATRNSNRGCAVAAEDSLIAMEKTYGQNIFNAIIDGVDPSYPADFQRIKESTAMTQNFGFGPPEGAFPIPGGMPPPGQFPIDVHPGIMGKAPLQRPE